MLSLGPQTSLVLRRSTGKQGMHFCCQNDWVLTENQGIPSVSKHVPQKRHCHALHREMENGYNQHGKLFECLHLVKVFQGFPEWLRG